MPTGSNENGQESADNDQVLDSTDAEYDGLQNKAVIGGAVVGTGLLLLSAYKGLKHATAGHTIKDEQKQHGKMLSDAQKIGHAVAELERLLDEESAAVNLKDLHAKMRNINDLMQVFKQNYPNSTITNGTLILRVQNCEDIIRTRESNQKIRIRPEV